MNLKSKPAYHPSKNNLPNFFRDEPDATGDYFGSEPNSLDKVFALAGSLFLGNCKKKYGSLIRWCYWSIFFRDRHINRWIVYKFGLLSRGQAENLWE